MDNEKNIFVTNSGPTDPVELLNLILRLTGFLGILILLSSCNSEKTQLKINSAHYVKSETVEYNGMRVEDNISSELDNIIYDTMSEYIYKYELCKDGTCGLTRSISAKDLKIYKSDSTEDLIHYVSLSGKDHFKNNDMQGWPQSALTAKFLDDEFQEIVVFQTGLIENYQNIWLHPPRQSRFMQNYSSPWPLVKFDSLSWHWTFRIDGNGWGNIVDTKWNDIQEFRYFYEIVGMEDYELNDSILKCYKIIAKGKSNVEDNESHFLFHPQYGFVTIYNRNIDDSETRFWLVDKVGQE